MNGKLCRTCPCGRPALKMHRFYCMIVANEHLKNVPEPAFPVPNFDTVLLSEVDFMRKFRAKAALSLLTAAAIVLLTACGSNTGSVSGTETETQTAAEHVRTTEVVTEAPGGQETGTVGTVRRLTRRDMLQASLERRSAYLAICKDYIDPEFTFACRLPENPLPLLVQKIFAQGSTSAALHFTPSAFTGQTQVPEQSQSMDSLKTQLTGMVGSYSGVWSIYICDLATGEDFVIYDKPMKSASVMKLFVMGAVYEAIESGRLTRTAEVTELLTNMICYSGNDATNELLAKLGGGSYREGIRYVNEFIASNNYGLRNHEYNGFQDSRTYFDTEHNNLVTAKACGLLLQRVYHRTFGPWSVCTEIENMMLAQDTRYKIPAGVERCADGVRIGNKTGELDSAENDVAVVYSPGGDYIICVFSADWNNKNEALDHIQDISETVYLYFN